MKLRRLSTRDAGFDAELAALTRFEAAQDPAVQSAVRDILADVRVRGEEACVAGVSALVTPRRHASPKGGEPHEPAKGSKAKAPVGFLRVDLVGQRAEGGDRGVPPASVSRMKCSLAPRP